VKSSIKIQENIPLAALTTFKIGGRARFFVRAENESDVIEAFNFAFEHDFDIFVLGGGSNVLISDEGFDGLVLQIALRGIEFKENIVIAQAGEDWDEFVAECVEHNLQGVECLSGIPGLIGGTPVQNVGAYGQEVSETITKVRVFDRKSKHILELTNADCKFAYRSSIFNTGERNRFIVLAVTFELFKDAKPKIVYKDLSDFFAGKLPNLAQTREAVLQIRRAKSMVIDENDPNSKSAGSFFKNPIVSNEKFAEMSERTTAGHIPNYKVDDQNVKIPAAWLIENSGFYKGYKNGNAGLSTRHTLAIINTGNAMAADILELKNEIQAKVRDKFAIELIPEPVLIGFP
jgi:UDP-N-acetylmuramate dehydrogenase